MGAWIEICRNYQLPRPGHVAPRVGAWIEIDNLRHGIGVLGQVAPRVGAWIEIYMARAHTVNFNVAPRVGAWIEISSGR